ncbi:MAG: hypothetical protein P8188_16070, partial [Gemmatimonadota bacterium]
MPDPARQLGRILCATAAMVPLACADMDSSQEREREVGTMTEEPDAPVIVQSTTETVTAAFG